MGIENPENEVKELAPNECWALLRSVQVGRLAVLIDGHPDIFPVNYVVDHGGIVFRSSKGTKLAGALSAYPVAFEVDGYDATTSQAWSVVVKGDAESIRKTEDVLESFTLPLFPRHGGKKDHFVRIVSKSLTGRQFTTTNPDHWRTPFMDAPHAAPE
ncbi:pyridoxamine 5'-phosphate oxidase family protein [Arthrobacter monumenti]